MIKNICEVLIMLIILVMPLLVGWILEREDEPLSFGNPEFEDKE